MASHDIDALMRRILDAEARMFDAEATILEELAKAMPRHVDDPKWLKAAAAKECCIAELIHALAEKQRQRRKDGKGNGQGGDDPPAATPREFSDAAFEQHFAPVLERYRNKKTELGRWRRMFRHRDLARRMAAFVKDCFNQNYARRVYGQVLRNVANAPAAADLPHACNFDQSHIERVFRHPRGGAGAGPNVFDPWNGRWQGKWTSSRDNRPANHADGPNPSEQHHIWDRKRRVGDVWVQPVTQSTESMVDGANIDEKVRQGKADLAINTYDTDCGIAGWVSKRQDGQNFELPHIGFRLSSGVLIWINQKHDAQCNALEEHFSIMFEWVNEDGVYGILGKRFKLTGSGPRELTRAEGAYRGEQHGSVYRHP